MPRFRISGPARADLARILETSRERWGQPGRARYAALLVGAVFFYRLGDDDAVEIVRVLHERMEPTRHVRSRGARSSRARR
jgi:plasmid stabilization system protein ParE